MIKNSSRSRSRSRSNSKVKSKRYLEKLQDRAKQRASQKIKFNIWDIESDDNEYQQDLKMMVEIRKKQLIEYQQIQNERLDQIVNQQFFENNDKIEQNTQQIQQQNEQKKEKKEKKEKKHKKKKNENEQKLDNNKYEEFIGPKPLIIESMQGKINYGNQLFKGEGQAYAHYIQEGKRIPRRGEVGITSEQIENYEQAGYEMSGSRHKALTAMRLKKEQVVYSIEENRALQIYNYEQKLKKEHKIIEEMQSLLQSKKKNF